MRNNLRRSFVVMFFILSVQCGSSGVSTDDGSAQVIPKANWSLKYVDSQETSCGNWAAINSFDGNPTTFWLTQFCAASPPPPHEIQIDLGGVYNITGFQYLPRQDGSPNGRIGRYEFYVSTDGTNWGSPVATGTFANDATQKTISFASVTGRYIRLRALSEVNGNPRTSMAEINVLTQCVSPSIEITQPQSYFLQTSTTLKVSTIVCLGRNLKQKRGVRFMLDGGPANGGVQVEDYNSPFRVTFTNLAKSEHVIDAFIIDSSGNLVSGNGTHDQVVQIGIGDYYVGFGDSITRGSHDDILSDNTSADGRNTGGGYEPILNTRLTHVKGYPQGVVNAGESGITTSDGLNRIATVLEANPDSNFFLIMFGTNDADSTLPLPSGLGLNPGDPGYAGSYKDNMQGIITAIIQAGKIPLLAKAPILLGSCNSTTQFSDPDTAPSNVSMREYNQVVDELRDANGITVVAPDFYSYFSTHLTQYADNCHPDGTGYQSMARLWCQALTGAQCQ